MLETHRERAILRAVELYYFEGLTQAAISERLGCTRWTVGRLLQEAEQAGIVQVNVQHPKARRHDLEQRLIETFKLRYARVVPLGPSFKDTLTSVARAGADLLTDIRPRPRSVGLAYGRTIGALSRAVPDTWDRGATIVQVSAAPAQMHDVLVGSSVRLLAKRTGGRSMTLPATPILPTAADMHAVAAQPDTAECLAAAEQADVIFYSPGAIDQRIMLLDSVDLHVSEVARLKKRAVGIVGNHFITSGGKLADPDVDGRTLGISLGQFRSAALSVAVGAGNDKVEVFRAILAAELAKALVIDCDIAEVLLRAVQ